MAEPSTPEYGRLSVILRYRFHMEKLLDVPPESFRPAPKVDSAIVRMIPLPASEIAVRNEKLFAAIVRTGVGSGARHCANRCGVIWMRRILKGWGLIPSYALRI